MVYKCFWTYRQLQKVFFLIFFAWSVLSTVSKLLKSNAFDDLDGWLVISIIAGQFWNIKLLFRFQVSRFKTSRDFNYTMWQVNALHLYLSFHVIYSSKLLCEKEGNKLFCEYCVCVWLTALRTVLRDFFYYNIILKVLVPHHAQNVWNVTLHWWDERLNVLSSFCICLSIIKLNARMYWSSSSSLLSNSFVIWM